LVPHGRGGKRGVQVVEGVQPLLAPRRDGHLEAAAFRFPGILLELKMMGIDNYIYLFIFVYHGELDIMI